MQREKPGQTGPGYEYTAHKQKDDLDAVIRYLTLQQVTLLAHDASGPPAIGWALEHPDHVAALVPLNTYYCAMPTLRSMKLAARAMFVISVNVLLEFQESVILCPY